ISIKDWSGAEIARTYADHWGAYNGLTYSTWEVNPPNPTGYAPTMMVTCMNDPGTGPTPDPLYNPEYSNFCYEIPFMPGQTQYMDTPVVPTSAFAGAGYNNPDCAYPNLTPAIAEVDGDGIGPYLSATGALQLTITALGDQMVPNNAYSGPSASTAPYNQKKVLRHYGFGPRPSTCGSGANCPNVTIGGVSAVVTNWTDSTIVATARAVGQIPLCAVQQQAQYGGSEAHCGELVITAANGKRSIDTVTVTIGGKTPTVITASDPMTPYGPGAIQRAIDAALPGDLIIVPPGTYNEMLLMWKPVRLQGVGAASSVINANTQPAGKLDPWRHQVNCLFGLALNGTPLSKGNPYDSDHSGLTCPGKGWNGFAGKPQQPQIDRLPLEGIVGWDTTTNGNLAQLLQEPTLMGAYEGAAITVLAKGVNTHGALGYYGSGAEAAFPTGSTVLTGSAADCGKGVPGEGDDYRQNPYPSNFHCNPSAIDGLSITDSSQGGGGIYVHAWGHNLQIANNRIYNNIGTLSGGIDIGQGESPDAYLKGTPTDSDPGSCEDGGPTNTQLPFCFNLHVNIHNNDVTMNTSIGDELFSGTPAGAGGVSVCTGADYYKFNYNWVCGNLSTGDGGGFSHLGFIKNGRIAHNAFLFNQSTNPTIATNGGGVIIEGAAPDGFTAAGIECGGTPADLDCPPGLPDGTGPHLVIDANLILGNGAESGSGGGLRLQSVNGTEVAFFPKNPGRWNSVAVTNNIIANNVAGWDGGGVSLQDALNVRLINNTIESNDTTASSGVLFNTLGAPLASAPGAPAGQQTTSASTSAPQAAGLVSMPHSSNLAATFPRNKSGKILITCPTYTTGSGKYQLNCTSISDPFLENDVLWQNRSYYVGVGAFATDYQQNIVTLFQSFTSTPAPSQPPTDATTANGNGATITGGIGACTPASYWDLGVRGDTGPGKHDSGYSLSPFYSVLTNTGAASEQGGGANDLLGSNPAMVSQYCNGSRTPPEAAANLQGAWKLSAVGWQVPPGIADATVPNPLFSLTPTATVDEGNNWVNMSWGPLTLVNPTVADPTTAAPLGNYQPAAGSPAIGAGSAANAPARDFFGLPRTTAQGTDIGAVQYRPNGNPPMP
ncbi:MAG: hypothetical protein KGL92_12330, partial [Gammaproteobacteria bacterium]|nr:hypothetical protein [Gammaproteobacteria bacterium]